ncbi:unnamed protein product [Cuscuta europaea]|uniref:RING-type E3 ubiquitin transferase n=1 Tax=Cuscuta europaea TaxID=41803 RepID=A0A9P0ZIM7_CUSEU|nr:unnamed protein product [Cuscuta europaea]
MRSIKWAAADRDRFEEFDYNEEEENEIDDELARLAIDNEEDYNISNATESSIATLEKVKSTEKGECAICLEDMEVNEMVTRMPCDHKFHGDCIVQWLGKGHVCPLCRFEMPVATTVAAMDGHPTA